MTRASAHLDLAPPPTASAGDLRALLAEPWVVGAFVGSLFEEGLEVGTARSYVQAVQHFATDLDGCPTQLHPAVSLLLRGFSASGPPLAPKRAPITSQLLARMLVALPTFTSATEAAMLKAVFTLAFFGCFRSSEYLTSNDPAKLLRAADVNLTDMPGSIVVKLKKTKTRQRHQPMEVIIPAKPDSPLCPVQAMAAYLHLRPARLGQSSALFCSNVRMAPYSARHLNSDLKNLLTAMGVPNASSFSSHSFRIGAATEAAVGGATLGQLQALGRWASTTALDYVDESAGQRVGMAVREDLLGPPRTPATRHRAGGRSG